MSKRRRSGTSAGRGEEEEQQQQEPEFSSSGGRRSRQTTAAAATLLSPNSTRVVRLYNPTLPPNENNVNNSNNLNIGSKLLNLVKAIQQQQQQQQSGTDKNYKTEDDFLLLLLEDAMTILQQRVASCQRKGLLCGNIELAEKVLAITALSSSNTAGGMSNSTSSKKKKQKNRHGHSNRSDLSSMHINNHDKDSSIGGGGSVSGTLDIQLVLSAIIRILEHPINCNSHNTDDATKTSTKDEERGINYIDFRLLLVALAADYCTASSEYIKQSSMIMCNRHHPNATSCMIAEYELMATSGKAMLNALEKRIRDILAMIKEPNEKKINEEKNQSNDSPNHPAISLEMVSISSSSSITADVEYSCCYVALISCLRAAASFIGLFGTKLSRSTVLLCRLREVGWEALLTIVDNDNTIVNKNSIISNNDSHHDVTKAAAVLLSTLPLAGGTNNQTPCYIWNQSLNDCIICMSSIIETTVIGKKPVKNKQSSKKVNQQQEQQPRTRTGVHIELNASDFVKDVIFNPWVNKMNDSGTKTLLGSGDNVNPESLRVQMLLQCLHGLKELMISLLSRECTVCTPSLLQQQMVNAEVDVESVLNLVETMLNFGTSAEAMYYSTKKRLRNEVILTAIEDGHPLLSPAVLVGQVANPLKVYAFQLWKAFMASIGSSGNNAVLVPYAQRIMKVSYDAILSSASSTLQRVVDPINNAQQLQDGKKKQKDRWLHTSIVIRSVAIQTFRQAILLLGTNPCLLPSSSARVRDSRPRNGVERAITIVCGCIVEEISSDDSKSCGDSSDWGTINERVELVCAAFSCLAACLKSGGEYLPANIRSLIDSVISTYLQSIGTKCDHPVMSNCSTKLNLLDVGIASLCTPWQDGSFGVIKGSLLQAASRFHLDRDANVAAVAATAIGMCHALDSPRAPALALLTQQNSSQSLGLIGSTAVSSQMELSTASDLFESLQNTKTEMETIRKRIEKERMDAESAKNAKKYKTSPDTAVAERVNGTLSEATRNNLQEVEAEVSNAEVVTYQAKLEKSTPSIIQDQDSNCMVDEEISEAYPPDSDKLIKEDLTTDYSVQDDTATVKKNNQLDIKADGDDDDEAMPMIIDCGPDEDDEDDE